MDRRMLRHAMNYFYRRGATSLLCLDEVWKTYPFGLLFPAFSPFYEEFNAHIIQMNTAGLTIFWEHEELAKYGSTIEMNKKPDDLGPQVLTMEHLEVAFIACVIPMAVSILTFTIEVSILLSMNFARDLALLCSVRAFVKDYLPLF